MRIGRAWSSSRPPPSDALYGNPGFGHIMYTAGSSTITGYFDEVRRFGAEVRRVLIDNAARHWHLPADELSTEPNTVVHAKSGRRLSYGDIAAFAELPAAAPEIGPADLKRPSAFRLIGKDVMRVELPTKVNGSAPYSGNVWLPNLLYGAVLRAPVEGSAPDKIDDAAARAMPGVVKIVRLPYGVGIVATTLPVAFAAKQALDVTWTRAGAAWGFDSEKAAESYVKAARTRTRPGLLWRKAGDASAAFAAAARIYEGAYLCDYAYHAQMEPLNAVASVSSDGRTADIWCGSQSETMAVAAAAKALGIPEDRVRLHGLPLGRGSGILLGGGFGRRGNRDQDFVVDAVFLSKAVQRPVKVQWTREDDVHNGRFRPMTAHFVRAGFDAAGNCTAWHDRVASENTTLYQDPIRFAKAKNQDFINMSGTGPEGYDVSAVLVEQLPQRSGVRTASLRGIGFDANKFATEVLIDEIATQRSVDPAALRLRLLGKNSRAQAVVRRVIERSEFQRKRTGRGLGLAFVSYSGTLIAGVAEVSVDRTSGKITTHNLWFAVDPGIAVQPDNVAAQIESAAIYGLGLALTERITLVNGVVQQNNFTDYQVPRMRDVPEIYVDVLSTDNHPTGVGQMATPVVAPAISNAVAALTGARLRRTPMTPDRVMAALHGKAWP
jgi:isoquinoline 1-oxidoreductase subunit beta